MKKIFLLILVSTIVLSGCRKNESSQIQPDQQVYAEISFNLHNIIPGIERADFPFGLPECSELEPTFAEVTITNTNNPPDVAFEGRLEVFTMPDGTMYTQAAKIWLALCPFGDPVCCEDFLLTRCMIYHQPTDGDPILIYAAPMEGSEAQGWLEDVIPPRKLNVPFTICKFEKYEVEVDVMCYEEAWYEYFGFVWFVPHEVVLREACFFGDICLKDPMEYIESHYANQLNFPNIDLPAIIEIYIYKWVGDGLDDPDGYWELYGESPYTNDNAESGWGEGAPLCVPYADYLEKVDIYKVDLSVMLKQGDAFPFIYMDSFIWYDIFEDEEELNIGDDMILDFVVGNCNADGADYVYPPWMNLPVSVTMQLAGNGWYNTTPPPNGDKSYFIVTLSDFNPPGNYDIPSGTPLDGWCGDYTMNIYHATYSATLVFSSLDPSSLMPFRPWLTELKLAQLTYLANNFTAHGINVFGPLGTDQGTNIQQSIWGVVNEGSYAPPGGSLAAIMASEANSMMNENYLPLPGGNAFILFFAPDDEGGYQMQLVLIVVDP